MQHTLIAVFDNRSDADRAQDDLLAGGFERDQVRVSKGDATGITDSVSGRGTPPTRPENESLGASIKHFFQDIFGTDNSEYAQKYSEAVARGHHVLTVSTANEVEVERAADIVERHGPVDIDEKHAEWAGGAPVSQPESVRMSGAGGMQQSAQLSQQSEGAPATGSSSGSMQGENLTGSLAGAEQVRPRGTSGSIGSQQRDTTGATAIPVVQEELKVGKREVQRGGVRIFSHVVETPVSEKLGLREEHVNVQRHPVDQPISTQDPTAFRDQTIELRETAEEPVVEKSARVVEEVVVGKDVSEREVEISDTVRHTEVEIEGFGAEAGVVLLSDDDSYRRHWLNQYGSGGGRYEDFELAYSYGSSAARNATYKGRKWNDIESELQRDWEARHGGGAASTWERFKSAIRYGWDRATSEDEYRSNWNSNYASAGGTYEDFAPAYRYGYEAAGSDRYRGRRWEDVESDLRSDWEARNKSGGASTWDRFKAAIRHGWDRITS